MLELFRLYLECSVAMGLLSLGLWALTPALGKRFRASSLYGMWLIVLGGFVIPLRPQASFSVYTADITPIALPTVIQVPQVSAEVGQVFTGAAAQASVLTLGDLLAVIWVVGIAGVLIYNIVAHLRFLRLVDRWAVPEEDTWLISLFKRQKQALGIQGSIDIYRCEAISSPMMVGFFRPKLLLPIDIPREALPHILRHELVHYRRKDLWFKLFSVAGTALHWYNPGVWLAAKQAALQCEISCDDAAMAGSELQERVIYGQAIVGYASGKGPAGLSTNFQSGKKGLVTRLSNLMDAGGKKMGAVVLAVVLLATAATGTVFALREKPEVLPQVDHDKNGDTILRYDTPGTIGNHSAYTDEEYEALMVLKVSGYKIHSVEEFDRRLEPVVHIYSGYSPLDQNVDFLRTVSYGAAQLLYDGNGETPMLAISTAVNKLDSNGFYGAGLDYNLFWEIGDKQHTTVDVRDSTLEMAQFRVQLLMEAQSREDLLGRDAVTVLQRQFDQLAGELSTAEITVTLEVEGVWAEKVPGTVGVYEPYYPFGITYNENQQQLYHNGERVRLFSDMREDGSFICSFMDLEGTVDLEVERTNGSVTRLVPMERSKADEMLRALAISVPDNTPRRISKADLPEEVLAWTRTCDLEPDIYVYGIHENGYYIYISGMENDFLWEPEDLALDSAQVTIYDTRRTGDGYALLWHPYRANFKVLYRDQKVQFTQ